MLFQARAVRSHRAGLYQPKPPAERRHKSAPKPPPAPDPNQVAAAQSQANKDAVAASQVNQVTPFGNLTYTGTVGAPDRTVTQTLDPQDQATLDQQRDLASSLTGMAQTRAGQIDQGALNFDGLTELPTDLNGNLQQTQDAVYRRNTQYLDPQFANAQHDLDEKLRIQGIPVGSDAYLRAQDNLGRQKQQAYSDARDAAVQAGGAEQNRAFGLAQTARNQGISERETLRAQPMNELAALLQGAPAIQAPGVIPTAQVAPADVTGAFGLSQSAKNAAYQGQVATTNGNNSAAAGIGSAALMAAAFF